MNWGKWSLGLGLWVALSLNGCDNLCHGQKEDNDHLARCDGNILDGATGSSASDINIDVDKDNLTYPDEVEVKDANGQVAFKMFVTEVTNEQFASLLRELKSTKTTTADNQANDCNGTASKTSLCYNFSGEGTALDGRTNKGGAARISESYSIPTSSYAAHPVSYVSWYGANVFCKALGKKLPTVEQWKIAVQSAGGNYPWGVQPSISCSNVNAALKGGTGQDSFCFGDTISTTTSGTIATTTGFDATSVTLAGSTPDPKLTHLFGNVAEWTRDVVDSDQSKDDSEQRRTIVGGGWDSSFDQVNVNNISSSASPDSTLPNLGFRCVDSND